MLSLSPLLLGTLLCFFSGTESNTARNTQLYTVNGILGRWVLLPVKTPSTKTVAVIKWYFHSKNNSILLIAEFRDGNLERLDPRDRFGPRLEMANETTLRIKDLEMEDSGKYWGHVRFHTAEIAEHSFNLTVYEPVSTPAISVRLISKTPGRCNVSLQCQVSQQGGVRISWKKGSPLRLLGEDSDGYQPSNGTDLHLSQQPNSLDSIFTCLVSNPVDQKMASFNVSSLCQGEDEGQPRHRWPLILGLMVFLILQVGFVLIWQWKKRRKTPANKVS